MKIDDDVDGFILAGGTSSRMGRPKHELMLGHRSLIERALSTMVRFAPGRITVVGDDRVLDTVDDRINVIADIHIENAARVNARRAPIFGLFTALSVAHTDWIAVLAVDLPFVSGDLLSLLASKRSAQTDAVVPMQPDGRLQPLCAMYRREMCRDAVRVAIENDELRLHRLFGSVRVRRVEPSEFADLPGSENFFFNVNTPEDLEAAAGLIDRYPQART